MNKALSSPVWFFIALMLAALTLAACGEATATQQPPLPDPVAPEEEPTTQPGDSGDAVSDLPEGPMLVLQERGGCDMAGPGCRTISFWVDGRVVVVPGERDPSDDTHLIHPELAADWYDIASSTDIDALVSRLPEGRCWACVDGIDLELELMLGDGRFTLDSEDVEFVGSEPFFAATASMIESVPYTLGQPAQSPDPKWNTPVAPAIVVGDLPWTVTAELPVVVLPGEAIGGGILDATVSFIDSDEEYVFVGISGTGGCASFRDVALVPMGLPGLYEVFLDTDDTCEAMWSTGYRVSSADLLADADGVVTIRNTNGTVTTFTV